MATQHFTEDSRLLALMPPAHASIEIFEASSCSDPNAILLAHMLTSLLSLIEQFEHEHRLCGGFK